MNEKKKKLGFKLILLSCLLLPGLQVLFVIGANSNYLIRFPFFIGIGVLIILLIAALVLGIIMFVKNRGANKRKLRKWIKIVMGIFMSFYVLGCFTFVMLLYGPNDRFRTWLITTAMGTMNHQHYCKWFYSKKQIDEVLNKNYIIESGDSTDASLIDKNAQLEYNEYEKEIMTHGKDEKYKIVSFEVNGAQAYIAAIYDSSKLKLAVTQQVGVLGEYVTHMTERLNGILAINAGGFVDQGVNSGEYPTGITIVDKQIVTNNEYGTTTSTGGIIGITDDNVLVLLKNTTADEAIKKGVRDAVSWGPFLIVNGVKSIVSGNGGWGGGARTAIGQRKDGTLLFLQVGSNSYRTNGAGMEDLVEIMARYGAYNAANLDGGTSSVLVVRRNEAINKYNATCHDYFTNYACAINDPIDALGVHRTRYISDAWVVVE